MSQNILETTRYLLRVSDISTLTNLQQTVANKKCKKSIQPE